MNNYKQKVGRTVANCNYISSPTPLNPPGHKLQLWAVLSELGQCQICIWVAHQLSSGSLAKKTIARTKMYEEDVHVCMYIRRPPAILSDRAHMCNCVIKNLDVETLGIGCTIHVRHLIVRQWLDFLLGGGGRRGRVAWNQQKQKSGKVRPPVLRQNWAQIKLQKSKSGNFRCCKAWSPYAQLYVELDMPDSCPTHY